MFIFIDHKKLILSKDEAFHLSNEESSKYFQRAVIQSYPLSIPLLRSHEAGIQANYFIHALGCHSIDKG